jgi:EAL domain-containing protein (putative c-di-GMP-specific phosphodiesterase class I)
VTAVVNLAHNLGLTVIAEGIETQGQRDEAGAAGCDFTQGFFHARPMGASAVDDMIGAGLDSTTV